MNTECVKRVKNPKLYELCKIIKGWLCSERISNFLLPLMVSISVIALWETAIVVSGVPNYVIPAPHAIVEGFIDNYPLIATALKYTMAEVIIGFIIGSGLGVLLAILFFYSSLVEKILTPLINAANSVPKIAFGALAVLWFGTGMGSKIFLAVISSFFPVMVNTLQGFRTSDPQGVSLMKTFGAKEKEIFIKYRWPFALHHVFVGLRNASTTTVIVTVITEMLGSPKGVGLIINITSQNADFLLMWAATLSISVCGVIFYMIILYFERRIVWWASGDLE